MLIRRFFLTAMLVLWTGIGCAAETVGLLLPVSGLGDQSFNDMTYAGIVQAKHKHQFKLLRAKCQGNSEADRMAAMEKLLAEGAEIVVSNGYEFKQVVELYAGSHPNRIFIINDFPLPGMANVYSTVFGQHEGSFLAGALAAWFTKSGRIGFVGGKDMPVIRAFLTGYREGARHARAETEVVAVFLSRKDEDTSGFDNPGLAYNRADQLYGQGVDIIFSVAGLSGNGVIRAAVKNNSYVIGVDADQDHMAKGNVLTSVIKRLDKATFDILDSIFQKKAAPGVYAFGLKENGVALSPMTYTRHLVPETVLHNLDTLRGEVIAGKIRVTDFLQRSMQK